MFFGIDLSLPPQYLKAALLVSLLSVWVLVGLFAYLNRYTKRTYFKIWTVAWLFYGLWLTMGLYDASLQVYGFYNMVRQWCVAITAVFLLWGSFSFLQLPTRQLLVALFMAFLFTWSYVGSFFLENPLAIQLPIFSLIGLGSIFASACFFRVRRNNEYLGAGLLAFGFFLWGAYMCAYPFIQQSAFMISAGVFISAVIQLFIAVSMIVLVLEEVRSTNIAILGQIKTYTEEKEKLESRLVSAEQQCQNLFSQARLTTELQQAYDDLRQTQHTVVQQERLRALGQMASGIAHDINNSLSPIISFSDLLDAEANLRTQEKKYVSYIRTAAMDISHSVARMRDFYRNRESGEPLNTVDVNHVAQQAVELTRPRWKDMSQNQGVLIEVTTDLFPALPEILANPTELREAITNLLLNAIDALPRGGKIQVSTRLGAWEETSDQVQKPGTVVLEVSDNGTGMNEETRTKCLEPFYTTKGGSGGTGLGLAMVYGMVTRNEGDIQIESSPAKGTAVRLIFPLKPQRQVEMVLEPEAPIFAPRPLKILCIDDEPLVRELLKRALEKQHYQIHLSESGHKGIEAFREAIRQNEPFELVITDLGMPGMDGKQVAEQIKQARPGVPIIMLTGWGSTSQTSEEPPPHVDSVLGKPPRISDLIATVRKLAGSSKNPGPEAHKTEPTGSLSS